MALHVNSNLLKYWSPWHIIYSTIYSCLFNVKAISLITWRSVGGLFSGWLGYKRCQSQSSFPSFHSLGIPAFILIWQIHKYVNALWTLNGVCGRLEWTGLLSVSVLWLESPTVRFGSDHVCLSYNSIVITWLLIRHFFRETFSFEM